MIYNTLINFPSPIYANAITLKTNHKGLVAVVDRGNLNRRRLALLDILGNLLRSALVANAIEPLIELVLINGAETVHSRGQDLGALGELVDVVDAQKRETDVFTSVVLLGKPC